MVYAAQENGFWVGFTQFWAARPDKPDLSNAQTFPVLGGSVTVFFNRPIAHGKIALN